MAAEESVGNRLQDDFGSKGKQVKKFDEERLVIYFPGL